MDKKQPHSAEQGASRVVLVTGSTSGIGLGIARALASRGHHIILHGFGEPQLIESTKQELQKDHGVKVEHIGADLSVRDDVTKLVKEVKDKWGRVDILVNNAGFQHVSPIEEFSAEKWDSMLAVMLTAPFLLIKELVPAMKSNGWGRIINISSAHGLIASPNKAAYVTVKHGIIGLTKVVALEAAESGVTCNAICPGYVDTPILRGQVSSLAEKEGLNEEEARVKFLGKFHATGKPVGIDHIAEAVCFLCSEAGSQMTGSNLVMDAGWTAK